MTDEPTKQDPFGLRAPDRPASWIEQTRLFEAAKQASFAQELQRRAQLVPDGPPPPISVYLAQVEAQQARQARLQGPDAAPLDAATEAARQALGKALSAAVQIGLLSEDRAVAMIIAGGVNDQPMSRESALAQLRATLAQAVLAGALTREQAELVTPPTEASSAREARAASSQGQVRPTAPPDPDAERDGPDRLEDLVYAALTIRPCHLGEHVERHRDSDRPCEQQALAALDALLDGLGTPPTAHPRRLHEGPDGAGLACCARDGNLATWLRYGRTTQPQLAPSSDAR